jgi:hypothetical protein
MKGRYIGVEVPPKPRLIHSCPAPSVFKTEAEVPVVGTIWACDCGRLYKFGSCLRNDEECWEWTEVGELETINLRQKYGLGK